MRLRFGREKAFSETHPHFIKAGLILALLFLFGTAHTQDFIDSTDAYYFQKEAKSALKNKKTDSALSYYKKAAMLFHLTNKPVKEVECLNACANILQKQKKFDEALMYLDKSQNTGFKIHGNNSELATTFHLRGIILYKKAEYYNAVFNEKQAAEIWATADGNNDYNVGKCYNNIGLFYKKTGSYDLSLKYYNKALKIWSNTIDSFHPAFASLNNNIGIIYQLTGDYDRALYYCNRALELTLAKKPVNLLSAARKYNNLGIIYNALGDTALAYEYYMKALKIRKEHYKTPNKELPESYNNLGKLFDDMGKSGQALMYYYKAVSVRKKIHQENHPDIARYYFNIGSVYLDLNDFDKAELYNFKALKIWNEFYRHNHPNIALCYLNFGKAEMLKNNYAEALKNINRAEKIITVNGKTQNKQLGLRLLSDKANLFIDKYYRMSSDTNDLIESLHIFHKMSAMFDELRKNYKAKRSMLALSKNFSGNFRKACAVSYELYNKTKNKNYIWEAFYFIEKNKSTVLTESILQSKSLKFSIILDELISRQEQIQNDIFGIEKKLQHERFKKTIRDKKLIATLEKEKNELIARQKELVDSFEYNYNRYYQLKYNTGIIKRSKIQDALNPGQNLIEYLTNDSSVFIITITRDNINIHNTDTDSLPCLITTLQNAISNMNILRINEKHISDYAATAYNLYRMLILPVEKDFQGDELIIIPDGETALIPFDILLTKRLPQGQTRFKEFPYLIKRYKISYGNSASILFGILKDYECDAAKTVLAIAPFTGNQNNGFRGQNELPASLKELKQIKKITKGEIYFGEKATRQLFLDKAHDFKVLHLATHTEINRKNPMESALLFYKTCDTCNSKITISELSNNNFHSELAVLSACNTGIGDYTEGEGIMSLARGFSYAGIPGVMLSLWKVNDNSSAQIMSGFYQYLKNGETKADALRISKLNYLKNSDNLFSNPYYWGGFIYAGKNKPLKFNSMSPTYFIIPAALIFVILILYFTLFRTKRF